MDAIGAKGVKNIGTLFSSIGKFRAGEAYDAQAEAVEQARAFEAAQLREKAKVERAAAQRVAGGERRNAELLLSSLQAKVAAGGGGTLDPSIVKLAQDIAGEGELRAMTAMYGGEEAARGLEAGAALRRHAGTRARTAGKIRKGAARRSAYATLLELEGGSFGSLFDKYGEDLDAGLAPEYRSRGLG